MVLPKHVVQISRWSRRAQTAPMVHPGRFVRPSIASDAFPGHSDVGVLRAPQFFLEGAGHGIRNCNGSLLSHSHIPPSPRRQAPAACAFRSQETLLLSAIYYPSGAGAGMRPSCSHINSRSNIRLNEACLPARKRSTWM